MGYKPNGYPDVSPYVLVEDAETVIGFLATVLGAERLRLIHHADGRVQHAEARVLGTVVMFGQMPGAPDSNVHVYVPDVDAVFEKAVGAGADVIQPPMQKDDPDRRCGVRAPGGSCWWFGTMVANDAQLTSVGDV